MNAKMKHRGYIGTVEVNVEENTLHGRVCGIRDVITYEAKTIHELLKEFRASVDDYLAYCEEHNEQPNKPVSGKLQYRPGTDRHKRLLKVSYMLGKSINDVVNEAIDEYEENHAIM